MFSGEVNLVSEQRIDLLPQFVLQLYCRLHAVLGGAQDAARATLFLLQQLGRVPLLQDHALDEA